MARSEAYDKYPQHTITLEPQPGRAQAVFRGRVVADSSRALLMREGSTRRSCTSHPTT